MSHIIVMNFIPLHDAKIYNEKNESMATFEWLTMPHILITNLEKKIVVVEQQHDKIHLIDFGSGSSLLSVELFRKRKEMIQKVTNIDYNDAAMKIACSNLDESMLTYLNKGIIQFHQVNLAIEFSKTEYDVLFDNKHHQDDNNTILPVMILDKSTLDCFLATPNVERDGKNASHLAYLDAATMLFNVYHVFEKSNNNNNTTKNNYCKYICCSYHEPSFLKSILSILIHVESIETIPRSDDKSISHVNINHTMVSSDPNFVYLYTCSFSNNNNNKSIEEIRKEIEYNVNYYYKHTCTYSSTINLDKVKKEWQNDYNNVNDDDHNKLKINVVYDLMIDENLKSMYSLKDFIDDWLANHNKNEKNADDKNDDRNENDIRFTYEEALDFIKSIE